MHPLSPLSGIEICVKPFNMVPPTALGHSVWLFFLFCSSLCFSLGSFYWTVSKFPDCFFNYVTSTDETILRGNHLCFWFLTFPSDSRIWHLLMKLPIWSCMSSIFSVYILIIDILDDLSYSYNSCITSVSGSFHCYLSLFLCMTHFFCWNLDLLHRRVNTEVNIFYT